MKKSTFPAILYPPSNDGTLRCNICGSPLRTLNNKHGWCCGAHAHMVDYLPRVVITNTADTVVRIK